MNKAYSPPDPLFIRKAFDSITPRYDLLNQVLSFGMSERWRQRSARIVLADVAFQPRNIVDLGCGTGKFLECFLQEKQWDQAIGVDFSSVMLEKARTTVGRGALWLEASFDSLPFLPNSLDLVISAFTLRSVGDLPAFFSSVYRILKPGGKVAFLDLTRPRSAFLRCLFYPYLRFVLPWIGRVISGQKSAYKFLSESVRNFQEPDKTVKLMEIAGFKALRTKSFSFGAATLIIASK